MEYDRLGGRSGHFWDNISVLNKTRLVLYDRNDTLIPTLIMFFGQLFCQMFFTSSPEEEVAHCSMTEQVYTQLRNPETS